MADKILIGGKFAYQLVDDASGDIQVDIPEQDNLILNNYLSIGRATPSSAYICIGAGVVTPPSVTDVDMGNQIKGGVALFATPTSTVQSDGVLWRAPYTVDFTGFTGQEVSEIGIRNGSATATLLTRALLKDTEGNATTVIVGVGQTLRITYALYVFIPFVIDSGTISTPHGDLVWEFAMGSTQLGSVTENFMWSYTNNSSEFWLEATGTTGSTAINVSASDLNDVARDMVNFTATRKLKYAANAAARRLGNPSVASRSGKFRFMSGGGGSQYGFFTDRNYILPANYDFEMTYRVSWGRL